MDEIFTTVTAVEKRHVSASTPQAHPDNPFVKFRKTEINQSIVDRFELQVVRCPSRLAVKTDKAQLTYAALNQTSNRVARAIVELLGLGNEPVAIFLGQGVELISAIFAVLKAGKAYVALDTSFPHSKCVSVVKHAQPGLIITDREHYPLASKFSDSAQLLVIDEISSLLPSWDLGLSISPEATAYIIYTSGSTGEPKGVFQDHRNVLHNVMRCTNMLQSASRLFSLKNTTALPGYLLPT